MCDRSRADPETFGLEPKHVGFYTCRGVQWKYDGRSEIVMGGETLGIEHHEFQDWKTMEKDKVESIKPQWQDDPRRSKEREDQDK